MTPHSLKKRFIYKLLGNLAAIILGIIALVVVPKALGPADFGRYEFLTANFNLVLNTLVLQLPVAYFNWISRKGHKENTDYATGLIFYVSLLAIVIFTLFICATVLLGINDWIWPDIPQTYLWFALGLSSATFLYQLCTYVSDGRALTVGLEKIRLLQNLLKTAGILALFIWGMLTLNNYFVVQMCAIFITVVIAMIWLASRDVYSRKLLRPWKFEKQTQEEFNSFAIQYARPLVITMLLGFCYNYFDRWFLQFIAGSSQQGYFSLSDRLGAIAIVFTTAMTPLLTREFAFAHEAHNTARLVRLFDHIKIFYFLAAVIGCFMSVQSEAIVEVVGGEKYKDAVIPVAIMALYPLQQTFGQLSASLLIATGQTKLYAKLAIIIMGVSLPVSYLLIASHDYLIPGLALGATGLAIKMVLIGFIGINIQLYFNTKMLGLSFYKWVAYQLQTMAVVYLVATASYWLINEFPIEFLLPLNVFNLASNTFTLLIRLGVSGLFYLGLVGILVIYIPGLANLNKGDLSDLFRRKP